MDCNGKDAKTKPLISSFKPQVEEVNDDESQRLLLLKEDDDENEDDESQSLLPDRNTRRKVQWNDINGNKLAEILEFQPRYIFVHAFVCCFCVLSYVFVCLCWCASLDLFPYVWRIVP